MEGKEFTPEDVMKMYTGDFGYWQIRTLVVAAIVKVPAAWQMTNILFNTIDPNNFECTLPEKWNHTEGKKWRNSSNLPESQSVAEEESYDLCCIHDYNFSLRDQKAAIFHVFNDLPRKRCTRFDHGLVAEWDFVCGRKILVSITQMFYILGLVVGVAVAPLTIKRFGPRHIMLSSMIIQIVFGVMSTCSSYLELKFLFKFIVAFACSHMFTASFKICKDIAHSTARTVICSCYETFWSFGVISLPVLSYFFPNWVHLQIALSTPLYFILWFFRLIPESPEWLLRQGMYSDAKELLETAAKLNEREMPDLDLENCINASNRESGTWIEFVKDCGCARFLSLHICWGFTFLAYYSHFINMKILGSHVRMVTIAAGTCHNFFFICSCEIIGIAAGLFLAIRHRRKWLVLGMSLITIGSCTTLCWIESWTEETRESIKPAFVFLGLTGRTATAASFTLLVAVSVETFEKRFRTTARTSCTIFAKTVLLSSPFLKGTASHGNKAALTAYGILLFLNGVSTLVFSFAQP